VQWGSNRGAKKFAAAIIALIVILPASAAAETVTIGRQDLSDFSEVLAGVCVGNCTATFSQQKATDGGNRITVPAAGEVTSWAIRGGLFEPGGTQAWALRILRPSGDTLVGAGTSPAVDAAGVEGNPIPLATPLAVQAGDRIGVTIKTTGDPETGAYVAIANPPGSSFESLGALADGTSQAVSKTLGLGELLLNATVQLDPPAPPPSPPTPDRQAPTITEFTIAPTAFVAANAGPALISAVGAKVFYKLSEPATTSVTIERGKPGFRQGKRCVKVKPKGSAKPCTRYSALRPALSHQGSAGLNSFKYMGRLGKKALKIGTYRLSATATDAAGNRSKPVKKPFRVVP
jgi:hypothetical protein